MNTQDKPISEDVKLLSEAVDESLKYVSKDMLDLKQIIETLKNVAMTRKPGIGSLLLLGAAAFGAYKYSKMTSEQKTDLKNKGKKFVDDNLGGLKNVFGGKSSPQQTANAYGTNGSTQG